MTSLKQKQYTLAELTKNLDVQIQGDPDCIIHGVKEIEEAVEGHITFLINPIYKKYLSATQASAVILSSENAKQCPGNAIICKNPHYVYAKIAAYFDVEVTKTSLIHPSATIGQHCEINPSAYISANCVLGDYVKVSAGARIEANTVIGDHCEIGEDAKIGPNVTLYHHSKIGKRSCVLSGAVIGSDGFGFATHEGRWHKVPQLGNVVIGDDVDIGANTSIDRGAIGDTVIEDGVKLDNLIQVAHNVRIGANTIIAGCVAIAGSTVIGKNCMVGGGSCFAGHISICDGVMITGMTAVTKSITTPGIYSSGIVGAVPNHEFRKNNARFHRLENLMQKVKQLETEMKALKIKEQRKAE